jgi:hypothetical protein
MRSTRRGSITRCAACRSPRDLDWTEWVRANGEQLSHEIATLTQRWRAGTLEPVRDRLEATWVAWILTTTDRRLRDEATHTLYWLGRGAPRLLHELALGSLSLDDPYVTDRLFAACYGLAMANQFAGPAWAACIAAFLDELDAALVERPTQHWLVREYAIGVSELVRRLHPRLVPERQAMTHCDLPLPSGAAPAIGRDDPQREEIDRILRMDFRNYTLGRLTKGRANYDMDHADHQEIVAEVLGQAWELGWRQDRFEALDRELAAQTRGRIDAPNRVERYGKKYGWIGFWETAGRRAADGRLEPARLSDVDIDPSFPAPRPPAPLPPLS